MDEVIVRLAEERDAAQIARVHVGTWQYAYRGQMPDDFLDSLSVEQRTKRWEEILSKTIPDSQTFVAERDGDILGFCSAGPCRDTDMDAGTGELWAIYVGAKAMHQGIGSALLTRSLEYLREQGYKTATLWVLDSNEKARTWYEKKGWKVEGKTKFDDRDGLHVVEIRYDITL